MFNHANYIFNKNNNGYFKGPYLNWHTALNNSLGYNQKLILEKVYASTRAVKYHNAYERDGIIIEPAELPLSLFGLIFELYNNSRLDIVDFGGALGSNYFSLKNFTKKLNNISWLIIEQSEFVKIGQDNFADNNLIFKSDIQPQKTDLLILGAVLQYLEDPYLLLEKLINNYQPRYIFLDRLPIINNTQDKLMVQVLPKDLYQASYPVWCFGKSKIFKILFKNYKIYTKFPTFEGNILVNNLNIDYQGLILCRD